MRETGAQHRKLFLVFLQPLPLLLGCLSFLWLLDGPGAWCPPSWSHPASLSALDQPLASRNWLVPLLWPKEMCFAPCEAPL